MDFSSNIDLIIRDLTEVCEIIDDLKHYPGVPSFQVEIAKSKCRGAAELIALLKNIREKELPVVDVIVTPTPAFDKIQKEISKVKPVSTVENTITDASEVELSNEIVESQNEKKETFSSSVIVKEVKAVEETVTKEVKEVIVTREKKREPENTTQNSGGHSIIADRFTPVSGSIYEQIGKVTGADDMSEKILTKPIASLTDAIGVNDRFLFIRELFKGDKEAYLQAISRLDNTENYAEAHSIALSLSEDGDKSEAIKHLLMIIKRKHPSNE